MPMATTCRVEGREVPVEDATELRDDAKRLGHSRPDFRCTDCGHAVRPHRGGGHAAAHFEHLERNANCPLSHRASR